MIRNILYTYLYGSLVFIQVFFIDKFDFKPGLIFLPLLILLFKNDSKFFLIYSLTLLFLSDFFRNNFVGLSMLIFLIFNTIINQFSKIWSKEINFQIKFFVIFFIYSYFTYGLFTQHTFINLILIFMIFGLRKVLVNVFIRFN